VMAVWQKAIGAMVTETGSYEWPFFVAAAAPLVGLGALAAFWGEEGPRGEGGSAGAGQAEAAVATQRESK
jgi:hypothetical protein